MGNMLTSVKNAAARLLAPRDEFVRQLRDLERRQAAAGAARVEAIAQVNAELAETPAERLKRLEAEHFEAGLREDRERGALQAKIRAIPEPALLDLEKFITRARRDVAEPGRHIERRNAITGERVVVSDGAVRLHVGEAIVAALKALRDELPDADSDTITRRSRELKAAIADALETTPEAE